MLQTIGQVKQWIKDRVALHRDYIAGGTPFSAVDTHHRGAIGALESLLRDMEQPELPQEPKDVDLKDPVIQEQLKRALDGDR